MYQGGYEYQGQTGYLVGHGNDAPHTAQGKRGWVSTTLSFTENLTSAFVVAQAFLIAQQPLVDQDLLIIDNSLSPSRRIALGRISLDI